MMCLKRSATCLSAILAMCAVQPAIAQEGRYSQTLGEQMQRVQSGQPAIPRANEPTEYRKPFRPAAVSPVARSTEPVDSIGGGAIPSLPLEVQTSGPITYVTGGIGDEETAQLKATRQDYNVHFLMSSVGGPYVSEVKLIATGKDGEVLNVPSSGPYFYAKMPAGTYTFTATAQSGETRKTTVRVPATGSVSQHFTFKNSD